MRSFDSGATRDDDDGKPKYEGYFSPIVIRAFGEYMLRHQRQADGTMRDSDNWQGLFGTPLEHREICMDSLLRHTLDLWLEHDGFASRDGIDEALGGIMFNVMSYWFALMLERGEEF